MHSEKHKFVQFKERGGLWNDLQPIEQYEGGEAPISPVAYSAEYKEVMGYFRAIFTKKEVSERALALTAETIALNQGNYTAWHYRRSLLHELGKDLGGELIWLNSIGIQMEKNYQIWHHRRCIFECWLRKQVLTPQENDESLKKDSDKLEEAKYVFDSELAFLDAIFESDSKNYHAWSHKVWLVERYELWADPCHLEFAEEMLDQDVQNNSVWSFRYFIKMRSLDQAKRIGSPTAFDATFVEEEGRYVFEKRLPQNWKNEAVWAYLRGLLASSREEAELSLSTNARRVFIGDLPQLQSMVKECVEMAGKPCFSPSMVVKGEDQDMEEAECAAFMKYESVRHNRFLFATHVDFLISSEEYEEAIEVLTKIQSFDQMRHKFWEWRKRNLQLKLNKSLV